MTSTRARAAALAAAVLGTAVLVAGCGADTPGLAQDVRIMVPTAVAGGYDVTARAAAGVLTDAGIAPGVEVFNLPGAGGATALARLDHEAGNPDLLMMMGLGVVGAVHEAGTTDALAAATPIARLVTEPEALVVPAASPLRSTADLVAALRTDPGAVRVGGGSTLGGPDHLLTVQLAQAVGVDPRAVDYTLFDGGGELQAALLAGELDVGVSGVGELADLVADGQLRVLATTGRERLPAVDAPTLTDEGIDLVFTNWRGLLAPPGLDEAQTAALVELARRLHDSPAWQAAITANGWTDDFATGADLRTFLTEEDRRVGDVLTAVGLT